MGRTILLGTTNPVKQEHLAWLLEGLPLRIVRPVEEGLSVEVEERGASHRENALLKAVAWSRASGLLAIASDGGLAVPALGERWDSLRTHRFAGPAADERARLEALLALMAPLTGGERRAFWREAVALAERGRPLKTWEAQGGEGVIAPSFDPGRIYRGFWVATAWYFPQVGKTYAEMAPQERRRSGEPWSRLRPRVLRFFRERLLPGEGDDDP